MILAEDGQDAHNKNKTRDVIASTQGLRHVSKLAWDDLTYRVFEHFEASGQRKFFEEGVISLGNNILQSPIERALFAFLLVQNFRQWIGNEKLQVVYPGMEIPQNVLNNRGAAICPQHPVEDYSLDFGFFINDGNNKLAFDIECDGIEFHGRTNEQISHDYHRGQIVSRNGFQIFRVSGKLINRNPLWEAEKFSLEVDIQLSNLSKK